MTTSGHHAGSWITSTKPPTNKYTLYPERPIFQPGTVKLAANTIHERRSGTGEDFWGYVVMGDSLNLVSYGVDGEDQVDVQPSFRRIGAGWSKYVAIEESIWAEPELFRDWRSHFYGLRNDGVLTRWTTTGGQGKFRAPSTYRLGIDVKAMALISKTKTYDTFLLNTRSGALKTLRIPTTSPLKPVIKTVRASTWQGFESFVVHSCGTRGGMVLTAIDKDTKTAHLYALSKANGTSTVIQTVGKIPGPFDAPVDFRWGIPPDLDPLRGE